MFQSIAISCEMYQSALLSSITLGRIPEGQCGPSETLDCYLHHSFEVADRVYCSDGFALKSVSFTPDGQLASPFACCNIGARDVSETTISEAMDSVTCEHGYINSIVTDTTQSSVKLEVKCIYTKLDLVEEKQEETWSEPRFVAPKKTKENKAKITPKKSSSPALKPEDIKPLLPKSLDEDKDILVPVVPIDSKSERPPEKVDQHEEEQSEEDTKITLVDNPDNKKQIAPPKNNQEKTPRDNSKFLKKPCTALDAVLPNGNIESFIVETMSECVEICLESDECTALTYVSVSRKCLLKNDNHESPKVSVWARENRVISIDFLRKCSGDTDFLENVIDNEFSEDESDTPCIQEKAMTPGKFLSTIKTDTFELCFAACAKNIDCTAGFYVPQYHHCTIVARKDEDLVQDRWTIDQSVKAFVMECNGAKLRVKEHDEELPVLKRNKEPCVYKNAMMSDGDFFTTVTQSKHLCEEICRSLPHCAAFAYISMNNKCSIKNGERTLPKVTNWSIENKIMSYDFIDPCNSIEIRDEPCVYPGATLPGGDIQNEETDDIVICKTVCLESKFCTAVTYVSSTKKCFLKNAEHDSPKITDWSKDNDVVSFDFAKTCVVENDSKKIPSQEEDTDDNSVDTLEQENERCLYLDANLAGGNIHNLVTEDDEFCEKSCLEFDLCTAATYVTSTGKCFLKNTEHDPPVINNWSKDNGVISFDFAKDCEVTDESQNVFKKEEDDVSKVEIIDEELQLKKKPCMYRDASISRGNIKSLITEDDETCRNMCVESKTCTAVTYITATQKCVLKTADHDDPEITAWSKENKAISYDYAKECVIDEVFNEVEHNDETKTVSPKDENDIPDNGSPCILEHSIITGDNVLTFITETMQECIDHCKAAKDCKRGYFSNLYKHCTIKDSTVSNDPIRVDWAVKNKITSFALDCTPVPGQEMKFKKVVLYDIKAVRNNEPCIKDNTIIEEDRFHKTITNTLNVCLEVCQSIPICAAASYVRKEKECLLFGVKHKRARAIEFAKAYQVISYDYTIPCGGSKQDEPASETATESDDNNYNERNLARLVDQEEEKAISKPCVFTNQIFSGGLIKTFNDVPNSDTCTRKCKSIEKCAAMTYSLPLKICWLRNETHEAARPSDWAVSNSMISIDFKCNENNAPTNDKTINPDTSMDMNNEEAEMKPCKLPDKVFSGGHINTLDSVESANDCIEECEMDDNCVVASYSPILKKCWLRDETCKPAKPSQWAVDNKIISFDFKCNKNVQPKDNNVPNPEASKKINNEEARNNPCKLHNQVFDGGLINTEDSIKSADECIEECKMEDGCVIASYSPTLKKCWLRDESHQPAKSSKWAIDNQLISFDFKCSENKQKTNENLPNPERPKARGEEQPKINPCKLPNQIFSGGLIETLESIKSADDCVEQCEMEDGCAVTSYSPILKKCWLRDETHKPVKPSQFALDNKMVSFDLTCGNKNKPTNEKSTSSKKGDAETATSKPCRIPNKVFAGGLITTLDSITSAADCNKACEKEENCVASTFSPVAKKCWLRNKTHQPATSSQWAIDNKIVSFNFKCSESNSPTQDKLPTTEKKPSNPETSKDVSNEEDNTREGTPCELAGQAFSGGLIDVLIPVKSRQVCLNKCHNTEGCVAATFSSLLEKCWLRDRTHEPPVSNSWSVSNQVNSYDFECNEETKPTESTSKGTESKPCVLKGMMFTGSYIKAIPHVPSAKECSKNCKSVDSCVAATFIGTTGKCYLRDKSRGDAKSSDWSMNNGAISYDFNCNPEDTNSAEVNTSDGKCRYGNSYFPKGTIKMIEVADTSACADLCKENADCVAISYQSEKQTCWLKNSEHDPVESTNWSTENKIMSFDMEFCSDEDFQTVNTEVTKAQRVKRGGRCYEATVRAKADDMYNLECKPMYGIKSILKRRGKMEIECCFVSDSDNVRRFEHFCADDLSSCPNGAIISQIVSYGERCVSTCLESMYYYTKQCWDRPMIGGYTDCGTGYINSIHDIPISTECCQYPESWQQGKRSVKPKKVKEYEINRIKDENISCFHGSVCSIAEECCVSANSNTRSKFCEYVNIEHKHDGVLSCPPDSALQAVTISDYNITQMRCCHMMTRDECYQEKDSHYCKKDYVITSFVNTCHDDSCKINITCCKVL